MTASRYEIEHTLVDAAFDRAIWRVGNLDASPHIAEDRSMREVRTALLAADTGADIDRASQLLSQIEEALCELICMISPPSADSE